MYLIVFPCSLNPMQDIASEDLHKNPKWFWSYIKSRKQESLGITSLKNKDGYLHRDTVSKADILNKQFHSVYTKEDNTNMPDKGPSPYPSMMTIQVNNQGVVKLPRGLRPFKATGPEVMIGRCVDLLHLGSFWCGGIVDNHLQKVWHLRMLLQVSHLCLPGTIEDPLR
jgi:hypothetical protein